ncbi:hypothetical protein Bbelb_347780 [Branchiostoma belcheri]|nr:hypothetical protein Bbelb_347780 [Branchiostoma belcheri]
MENRQLQKEADTPYKNNSNLCPSSCPTPYRSIMSEDQSFRDQSFRAVYVLAPSRGGCRQPVRRPVSSRTGLTAWVRHNHTQLNYSQLFLQECCRLDTQSDQLGVDRGLQRETTSSDREGKDDDESYLDKVSTRVHEEGTSDRTSRSSARRKELRGGTYVHPHLGATTGGTTFTEHTGHTGITSQRHTGHAGSTSQFNVTHITLLLTCQDMG